MLNVLIVDDELIVRKGLKALINWEEYEMDVVFEATNGEDALEIINNNCIDVLITDIRMPLMDGIELTRKVKENFQLIKVILLTCYNDFEYVQEALQLGASSYILKTDLEDGNLEKQLLKISREIKLERSNKEIYKELEIQLKKSEMYLQEKQIKSILKGEFLEEPLQKELKWLYHPYIIMRVMICKLDGHMKYLIEAVNKLFLDESLITIQNDHHSLYIIMSLPINVSKMYLLKWQEKIINQLTLKINEFANDMSIYYVECEHINELYEKYELLNDTSMKHHFYNGYGRQNRIEPLSSDLHSSAFPVDVRALNELTILRDWNKVRILCESYFDQYESLQLDPRIVKANIITMIETIMIGLQSNSDLISSSWGKNSIDHKGQVEGINFFYELKTWFYNGFDYLEENRLIFMGGMNQVVKQAVTYIEANFFKEITLEDLSSEVGISQSYLSTIFKKVIGKSFIEYLNDIRIEKAKQLFFTSNLKVFEVSDKVGFNDPKYFSKQFKRITGVSPNQFKKYI